MLNRILIATFYIMLVIVTRGNSQNLNFCLFKDSARAQTAIDQKQPTLLLVGGVSPIRYRRDSIAEAKFGFKFEELGDVLSDDDSCLRAYSKVIFSHLDNKFGRVWRRQVRSDVLFLKSIRYRLRGK